MNNFICLSSHISRLLQPVFAAWTPLDSFQFVQKQDHYVRTATKALQVWHAMGGLCGMCPQACSRFHVLADPIFQSIALFCMVVLNI